MRDFQLKQNEGGLPDSIIATNLGAGESNSFLTESKGAVESSGQTLAPADGTGEDTDQLSRALAIYGAGGGSYHNDTGAVNAYVLTPVSPKESPPAYFDGFTVAFRPGTPNTGSSTVNVASLGVVNIRNIDGTALTGGELNGVAAIQYNASAGYFIVASASSGYNIITNNLGIKAKNVTMDSADVLDPSDKGTLLVIGDGGPVTIANSPSAIADGYDGQILIIVGRDNTATVTFQDSGDDYIRLKSATATLGLEDVLIMQYADLYSGWNEICRAVIQTPISDPSGGTTVDSQARTAINAILAALRVAGVTQ